MVSAQVRCTERFRYQPLMAITDNEESNPAYKMRPMSEPPEDNALTDAPPPEERDTLPPEADDAEAAARMRTMLPSNGAMKELVEASDSVIGDLIKQIADAARIMSQERADRAESAAISARNQTTLVQQQGEILEILQKTAKSTEANHELMLQAVRGLQDADVAQDRKLAGHGERLAALEGMIEQLRVEILSTLPEAVQLALAPYVDRLEALEREAADMRAADARAPVA